MSETKKLMDEIISSVKSDLEKAFENALATESFTELETQIAEFGITIFAIIDVSGQPLLIKPYATSSDENKTNNETLFAGFIAALSNFANAEFSGKIQDFAINNQRIFFKFVDRVIFIAGVKEVNISNLKIQDFYVFSEQIFELTVSKFLPEYELKRKDFVGLYPWLDTFSQRIDEYLITSLQAINIQF